ncbi:MAG: protoporphyrinogen oxidase [bacterium]
MSSTQETNQRTPRDSATDLAAKRVLVVGGGIAGLTAAYYLKKRGTAVELVEREAAVGGMVRSSLRDDKYIVELGPQAFAASSDAVSALARELSIHNLIVGENEVPSERYAYIKGGLQVVPRSAISFLRSPLIPAGSKIKMLTARFFSKEGESKESLASFVKRRMGDVPLEALLDPFTSQVWAGDCQELEAKSAAPALMSDEDDERGFMKGIGANSAMPGLLSFKWGMGTLTARLEEMVRGSIRAGLVCSSVQRRPSGGFCALVDHGKKTIDADAVVVAVPAHAASSLLASIDQALVAPLAEIPYAPLAAVHASFKAADIKSDLKGAGFVVPRREGMRLLSAVFPSALFPGRCPSSEKLITCFIGGALDPAAVELDDAELVEIARAGLKEVLGIDAAPRFTYVKRWLHAMPQLTQGHAGRVAEIERLLKNQPGIFVTGGYLAGATVADAITHARDIANSAVAYLRTV